MIVLAHTQPVEGLLMAACGALIYIGVRNFVASVAALIAQRRDRMQP